jgi:hypothetical protein
VNYELERMFKEAIVVKTLSWHLLTRTEDS